MGRKISSFILIFLLTFGWAFDFPTGFWKGFFRVERIQNVDFAYAAATSTIYITTTGASTWYVPADWDPTRNSIEVIGAGGGGGNAASGSVGGGGGGGAYAAIYNWASSTPGTKITVFVGLGGTGTGPDTGFNDVDGAGTTCDPVAATGQSVCAKGGIVGPTGTATTTGGAGGTASSSIGYVTFRGGTGGEGNGNICDCSGGGGGAAGRNGVGWNGGNSAMTWLTTDGGGGGGGADAGSGSAGVAGSTIGGNGGIGPTGTAGGTGGTGALGTSGSNGSGGGGSDGTIAGTTGSGGAGIEWDSTHGSGGGAGGTGNNNSTSAGGNGGLYGGGGGGSEGTGGSGASGIIVIKYQPIRKITGTLYNNEGQTADSVTGRTIKLFIGTSTPGIYSTTTTASSGFYGFTIDGDGFANATDSPIIAWLDGGMSQKAVAITKASSTLLGANIAGLDLYKNAVIVKQEGATSTNISDLARYDGDNDSDLPYIANNGTLAVNASNTLYVWPGSEFRPGGPVTVHASSSSVNGDGSVRLARGVSSQQGGAASSSILTMASSTLTLGGSFYASSSSIFTSLATTTFNATTTGKQIIATSSPFYHLAFDGIGGTWTFKDYPATTTGNFFILNGTTTAPGTTTRQGITLSIGGNYFNGAKFLSNNGTTTFNGTTTQALSGLMIASSTFMNIELKNTAATTTFAASASTTNNFYAITPNVHAAFAASATSTFTNLIVNGQANGTEVRLWSNTQGTQWNLHATGTRSVSYASVKDSNACSSAGDIDASDGTNDNEGNNNCWTFPSTLTQNNFIWAANDGNLTTGGRVAAANTAISSLNGDTHRLRMDVGVSSVNLNAGSKAFTLQYKTLGAGCSAVESWTTLGAIGSGAIWRGYDNASVSDGATLSNLLVSQSDQFESYEEDGSSVVNPTAISVGGAGEWDWVLQNNSATVGQAYCFKMVKTTALADLNSYTNYPQLTAVNNTTSGGGSGATGGVGGESAPAGASGGGTTQSGGGSGDGGTPPGGGTGGGTGQGGGSGGGVDAEPHFFKKYARFFEIPFQLLTSGLGELSAIVIQLLTR